VAEAVECRTCRRADHKPPRANGIPYQGINVLMLWGEASERGYAAPIWMTFKQPLELGGHVRKGEHGSLVVYADRIHRTETNERGEEEDRSIPFLKIPWAGGRRPAR
jgi:antirestriction protein ArdC